MGKDPVTYINFNINILCPESQPQLPTVPDIGQPYWEAHITLFDDAAMRKKHSNNVYKLSHLTFTQYNNGVKNVNLHVYQDNADIKSQPFPSEISKTRLTIFRNLVFSFITHHPTQLEEMVQKTYVKAQKPEQAASRASLGLPATYRLSRGQSYTRSGNYQAHVTRGGRKFTLKISSHRTRYNKRKHKTINSTQKNKRRK
jgi:hypothetical protein